MTILAIIFLHLLGFLLSYSMLKVEHASEERDYTHGARLLNIAFSLGSWIMIIIILLKAWFDKISNTGYWSKPIKPKDK